MSRNTATALACLAIQTDGNHALRLNLEGDLIAENNLAFGHSEAALPAHCDGCQWRSLNATNACSAAGRKADRSFSDGEVGTAKRVRDGNLDLGRTNRHVERLAEGRILQHTT